MRHLLLLSLIVVSATLLRGQTTVLLPETHYGYDDERSLLLVRLVTEGLKYPVTALKSETATFTFPEEQRDELRYDTTYTVLNSAGSEITLAFTRLPFIKIDTDRVIDKTEHLPATLSYVDDDQTLSSTIGARWRGGFSLRYRKKSFDIEFWNDSTTQESVDVSFGELREDDDWVLDALFNEPMRVNSYVAHKLWLDMHSPYYQEEEADAKSGADVMFVEVFFNEEYHGLFMLTEQVDRKQLKLKKEKDGEIRGLLYKAENWSDATLFTGLPPLAVSKEGKYENWVIRYPDLEGPDAFVPLYELIDFVVNSSDEDFRSNVGSRLQLDNMRDMFLFLNVVSLTDNHGKNLYLARYNDDEPYFYIPWDMDASFGNDYRGERNDRTDLWLANGLQERLLEVSPDSYNTQLCERYDELREGVLDPDKLIANIDRQISYLRANGVPTRERKRWGNSVNIDDDEIAFTKQFIRDRIAHLDGVVCGFSTSSTDPLGAATASIVVYPNPTDRQLNIEHSFTKPTGYSLLNATGQIVASGYLGGGQDHIDVSQLRSGMYFLRVGQQSARVVISR